MDSVIKDTVYGEVEAAVETKVNDIITPQTEADHVNGELNFLRAADVSQVVEERDLLAAYGDIIFDCDCATNKRVDYQECQEVENRDVRLKCNTSYAYFMKMDEDERSPIQNYAPSS